MEQAVKQRIVGTVVLLALGLLVVPVLFNSSSEAPVVIDQTIPTPPATAIAPVEPVAAVSAPSKPASEHFAVAEQPIAAPAAVNPAKTPAPTPTVVQPAAPKPQPAATIPAKAQAPSQITHTQPQAALNPNGLPQGYVIQVGAFSSQSNAEQLLKKLKAKGFQAYSSRTKSGGHAVLVGPHIDRQQAQRTAQHLKRDLGLDSMIKPFQP